MRVSVWESGVRHKRRIQSGILFMSLQMSFLAFLKEWIPNADERIFEAYVNFLRKTNFG